MRYVLPTLLGVLALNAFGGGIYGLSGAKGVPPEWLEGSPFTDYTIPSMILFVVVGGSLATATVAVLAKTRSARALTVSAALILLAWIVAQVAIIGYVSWLQPTAAIAALMILGISRLLP